MRKALCESLALLFCLTLVSGEGDYETFSECPLRMQKGVFALPEQCFLRHGKTSDESCVMHVQKADPAFCDLSVVYIHRHEEAPRFDENGHVVGNYTQREKENGMMVPSSNDNYALRLNATDILRYFSSVSALSLYVNQITTECENACQSSLNRENALVITLDNKPTVNFRVQANDSRIPAPASTFTLSYFQDGRLTTSQHSVFSSVSANVHAHDQDVFRDNPQPFEYSAVTALNLTFRAIVSLLDESTRVRDQSANVEVEVSQLETDWIRVNAPNDAGNSNELTYSFSFQWMHIAEALLHTRGVKRFTRMTILTMFSVNATATSGRTNAQSSWQMFDVSISVTNAALSAALGLQGTRRPHNGDYDHFETTLKSKILTVGIMVFVWIMVMVMILIAGLASTLWLRQRRDGRTLSGAKHTTAEPAAMASGVKPYSSVWSLIRWDEAY